MASEDLEASATLHRFGIERVTVEPHPSQDTGPCSSLNSHEPLKRRPRFSERLHCFYPWHPLQFLPHCGSLQKEGCRRFLFLEDRLQALVMGPGDNCVFSLRGDLTL